METITLQEYCEQARSFVQAGEADKAIRIVRHILRQHPQHVQSYRLLGQALLAAGNYEEADQQFRRVLSADPEDVASRVGLAKIYEARGRFDKAIWQMQRAQELSPGDADLRAQLGRLISAQAGDGTPQQPDLTRAALARIHASNGLYDKAVQEFRAVLAENPGRVEVEATLAEVLWRSGQTLQAGELGRRILDKLPHALKANLIVGALCVNSGQLDAAQPYLELAQALDPENWVAQSLFGEQSPLPPRPVTIERLAEEQVERIELKPPAPPAESAPVVQNLEPESDWRSTLHEEEAAPMSDEERPEEVVERRG
jgi:predicted Zn-dependent protease